jgi:hypothetical protein
MNHSIGKLKVLLGSVTAFAAVLHAQTAAEGKMTFEVASVVSRRPLAFPLTVGMRSNRPEGVS